MAFDTTDQRAVNTIRTLSIDAVQKANSGHPGLPMGCAPMAYALWQKHLNHHAGDPLWPDRDRFVLSPGHGSALLYSLLHLYNYLGLEELKNFRQAGSKTPGHPENFVTPGVEATTGPLGQGSANAVGMAMAERHLAHRFNRPGFNIVDHFSYALVSDGDLMEGISAEAASLAGHLKLGKLIYLYDDNRISLDGPTDLTFTEDAAKRYESYGWQVLKVSDGDQDLQSLDSAIQEAQKETARPSIIIVRTTIGYGSPNKAGKAAAHGSPLGDDELAATKAALGFDGAEYFVIPDDVKARTADAIKRNSERYQEWNELFARYQNEHPELSQEFTKAFKLELDKNYADNMPNIPDGAVATRKSSGAALNAIAQKVPFLFGGDADLSCSTNTALKDGGSFSGESGAGRNIHYGVREHAMAAAANGMAYHGGVLPYTATFFCFSDYMRPSVRLAALNGLPVIHVWTHDSVWLGEDGPTHQPIEHLSSLRAMPNLHVERPADAHESNVAWQKAVERRRGPTGLVFSRQNLPQLDRSNSLGEAEHGAYVLSGADIEAPQVTLLATGSEVSLAIEVSTLLKEKSISSRVVSMPCWERFLEQEDKYIQSILPGDGSHRVSIEAGVSHGWHQFVGLGGRCIAMDSYGASAPLKALQEHFGFTAANIVKTIQSDL